MLELQQCHLKVHYHYKELEYMYSELKEDLRTYSVRLLGVRDALRHDTSLHLFDISVRG